MGNPFQEHELNRTSTSNSNQLKQEPMTNYWLETFNSNIWPIENQEKETKHVLELLIKNGYGRRRWKVEETYVVEDNGSDHATWMLKGSKMSESATTWGFPTHKIRQREGEQVSQRNHSNSRE